MKRNYEFRNSSEALPALFKELIEVGEEVGSRNGRTYELDHIGITLTHPEEREILVPGRKCNLAAQIAETMWVLGGRNDIGWLSHYLPRAADFSDDGVTWRGGYGPRIRQWWYTDNDNNHLMVDQLQHVVDLLKKNPMERRAVISIYDPAVDTEDGKDIPCNDLLMFTNRLGKLDLQVVIRSNDAMWGWSGINAFEWSVLQEIVARMVGVEVGSLHFSVASFHLYQQHWDRANKIAKEETVGWDDFSPRFNMGEFSSVNLLDSLITEWFEAEEAIRTGSTLAPQLVAEFPEPMMQSFLRVIQWWWSGDTECLAPLGGSRLAIAAAYSMQPRDPRPEEELVELSTDQQFRETKQPFVSYVNMLHEGKHAAYGDSWKRRGENIGILANIARKIDRLESGGETPDETRIDTAIDLLVYLCKYRWWMVDEWNADQPCPTFKDGDWKFSDVTEHVADLLAYTEQHKMVMGHVSQPSDEHRLVQWFNSLEVLDDPEKLKVVDAMIAVAFRVARDRWAG